MASAAVYPSFTSATRTISLNSVTGKYGVCVQFHVGFTGSVTFGTRWRDRAARRRGVLYYTVDRFRFTCNEI